MSVESVPQCRVSGVFDKAGPYVVLRVELDDGQVGDKRRFVFRAQPERPPQNFQFAINGGGARAKGAAVRLVAAHVVFAEFSATDLAESRLQVFLDAAQQLRQRRSV